MKNEIDNDSEDLEFEDFEQDLDDFDEFDEMNLDDVQREPLFCRKTICLRFCA